MQLIRKSVIFILTTVIILSVTIFPVSAVEQDLTTPYIVLRPCPYCNNISHVSFTGYSITRIGAISGMDPPNVQYLRHREYYCNSCAKAFYTDPEYYFDYN